MLVSDPGVIGEKLRFFRKRAGLTQAELAEKAGLADRTYADIERGMSTMRVSTLIQICEVLNITPNDVLSHENEKVLTSEELVSRLKNVPPSKRRAVYQLVELFLSCLEK